MKQIDQLIICSPYREPDKYWTREESTQEFFQHEGRRPAGFSIAGGANGTSQIGKFVELPLVNIIRKRLIDWKENGRPGLTGVSQELLEHWYDKEKRNYPFFFCQLEAIETIIFLNEAPANYTSGLEIPGDGGEFVRWCSKMATGSGKTIVMAMLVAYNILNKVSYRQDTRFSKHILIVAPGLTVKTRLAVLDPTAENNYYTEFQVVPSTLMEKLREGNVKIINWHMLAWDTQDRLNGKIEKKQIRSVDKRKQIELSDTAYAKQVLGEMASVPDILVLNDEAHHAWRSAAESKVKGVTKDEIDNTVWVGGLDKLGRKVKILRCHDLSATPFAPTGKKTTEVGLFDWIISDFGLNDAIESGLVKTPRVVLRDDGKLSPDYKSRLYHIYADQEVKDDINQKQVPKETPLPQLIMNAYDLLATDWLKAKQEWIKNGITDIPPVMISIANTTVTADRIKHYFDSKSCIVKEICEPERTLQIDSKILGSIENEDETLTGSKAELAAALREKVDTVGKVGKPGQHIQNVISVGMLSEGWDAKNVSQIMGLRAFSSQLLCEQVVGRGLRRVSYDFDENQMLSPEYVNIFGVPFSFIPHEGAVAVPRPSKPKVLIEPTKSKKDYKISFPNILRVDTVYQSTLSIDYNAVKTIEIDPSNTITKTDLGGVIDSDVTPAALTEVDLKLFAEKYRMQSVIFRVATSIYGVEKGNWKGNQYDFMAQLLRLTEEFIKSNKIRIKTDLFSQDATRRNILITLNISRIIQHFWRAIKEQNAAILSPVFDKEKPIRSTSDMPTWWTSKPNIWHERSHINHTVFDSTWEANNANILDSHPAVHSFVKNDHLGFSIKYHFNGVVRNYYPDYIIHLKNGDYLVLEVKGQDNDETRAKRDFLNLWVKAVNQTNKFGTWHWAVVFNSHEIHDILSKYKEFPADSFLPIKERQTESILADNSAKLSDYFDLSVEELRKEKNVEAMVQRVMKEMLTRNIDKIFNVIREASKELGEAFVDQLEFQEKIYSRLDGLTPPDTSVFEGRVRNAIKEAKRLEKQSLDYLISAEFLNDTIITQMVEDFSPVVLQMSRAVESELQLKLFKPFTNFIRSENPNVTSTYSDDFRNADLKQFAEMIQHNRTSYTLGQMHFILKITGSKGAYENSLLAQDFHDYLLENFDAGLSKKEFLDDVFELQKKYRNKSAHVNVLSKDEATDCKFLVRKILTRVLSLV
jgi:type III restriction enzyme